MAPGCSLGALAAPGTLALQGKIQILAVCKGICVLLMGNPITFSATLGLWLQAAPWEPWQPLGLCRFREKSEFWSYVKGSAFCLWEILHLFGHPKVLAPGCSLGVLAAPRTLAFQRKIRIFALCKGICVLPMGNPITFSATLAFWIQAAPLGALAAPGTLALQRKI